MTKSTKEVSQPGLLAIVSAAAATFGAIIAVGQAGSEFVKGYYLNEIQLKKAEQDLALNNIKSKQDIELAKRQSDSSLSEAYLKIIFNKETQETDKFMIVKALTQIDSHPLNAWAKAYQTQADSDLAALKAANQLQIDAFRNAKPKTETAVADIEARIEQQNALYNKYMSTNDVDKAQQAHQARMVLVMTLSEMRGSLSKIEFIATASTSTSTSTSTTQQATNIAQLGLTAKLTVEVVKTAFPSSTRLGAIEKNLPFILAAIDEYKFYDAKLIATVFGTIRAETEGFEPISEFKSKFNTRDNPFDLYEPGTSMGARLGNTEPGDGERFKSRGFAQIAGRTNYAQMSTRLGLGSLLIDRPEEVNDPALSARLLCAFISAKLPAMRAALEQDDLRRVRALTNGGSHGLDGFTAAYKAILARL